ncbi:MAG: DUF2974 domain-containing protein [Clostridia bacterium]|nr:DUF2974 domain-containing protein [Clostridia bacterium]
MTDVFDYLKWRGDLSFDEAPFCEIDALIFAEISYVDLGGIVDGPRRGTQPVTLRQAAEKFFVIHDESTYSMGVIVPNGILMMFRQAAQTRRFADVTVSDYVSRTDDAEATQFSAVAFSFAHGKYAIAYRGTDDSVAGWRENFDMAFEMPVPAQICGAGYLDGFVGSHRINTMYVCGHSKGGNLAVYSSAFCSDKARAKITGTYNFDGPGFRSEFYDDGRFSRISARLHTFVPESSIIGMLLDIGYDYTVVRSSEKGIMQHDGLSWGVEGTHFISAEKLNDTARHFDESFSKWLTELPDDQRKETVDTIFSVIYRTESHTLTELAEKKELLGKALIALPAEKRKILIDMIRGIVMDNLGVFVDEVVKPKIAEIKIDIAEIAEKIAPKSNETNRNIHISK